jgi:REP element-mobilizing transposase RayT
MSHTLGRGHEALRRHRWSAPGCDYFLTVCTNDRKSGLQQAEITTALLAHSMKIETAGNWLIRCMVVMPDHIHLLITLEADVPLSSVIRNWKGPLTPVLRRNGLSWQRGYFDHRMRTAEDRLPVFLYIFLNPYRAQLLTRDEKWPGYYCAPLDWAWFGPLTNSDCPFPEWLGM